jgi:hypothetical protein
MRQNRQLEDKYIVRLPDGMRDSIKLAAAAAGQSMNTWIIRALLQSLDKDGAAGSASPLVGEDSKAGRPKEPLAALGEGYPPPATYPTQFDAIPDLKRLAQKLDGRDFHLLQSSMLEIIELRQRVQLQMLPAAFEVLDPEGGLYLTRSEQAARRSGHAYNGLYRRAGVNIAPEAGFCPGDVVVLKSGNPGEWTVSSVSPTGVVFFEGFRGPFTAANFMRRLSAEPAGDAPEEQST